MGKEKAKPRDKLDFERDSEAENFGLERSPEELEDEESSKDQPDGVMPGKKVPGWTSRNI